MRKGVAGIMDWNKAVVIAAQCVVFVGLLVALCLGHDSAVSDGLFAVSGSLTGLGIIHTVSAIKNKV